MAALVASIRASPIAAVISDPKLADYPVVAVNQAFCTLTGYSEADIVGRNCRFLGGPGTDPAARAALSAAVRAPAPALVELINYRKDGTAFLNAVMIAPVLAMDGELDFFIGSQMELAEPGRSSYERRAAAEALMARLTPRQRDVLGYLIRGLRNKQIGGVLGIDEKTVKMHRAQLLSRLGVASSAVAVRIAVEAGFHLHDPD